MQAPLLHGRSRGMREGHEDRCAHARPSAEVWDTQFLGGGGDDFYRVAWPHWYLSTNPSVIPEA